MEPARPQVDAFLLDWIPREPLKRNGFFEQGDGNCRLRASLAVRLSETVPTWGSARVAGFQLFCGVDHTKLLPQGERPTPVDETPEAYTKEKMRKFFFAIVKERDALAFELILKSGPREQELTNLKWPHLDLGPTPTVSYKTREEFRTKTGTSRTVPLERGLADRLAEWRKNPTARLVFPTKDGKVEGQFLRTCKEIAKLSGQDESNFWLLCAILPLVSFARIRRDLNMKHSPNGPWNE